MLDRYAPHILTPFFSKVKDFIYGINASGFSRPSYVFLSSPYPHVTSIFSINAHDAIIVV